MLFPFHAGLSDGTLLPEKLLQELSAAGVRGLEVVSYWVENHRAEWQRLSNAAKEMGMEWACCDISANLVGENEADRQKALETVARGVEFCASIGCPTALVYGSKPAVGMSNEDGRKIYAESLAKAVSRGKESGVTITIEDFDPYPEFVCSGAQVLEVLNAAGSPELKVTFDTGNFLIADDSPSKCYEILRDRVVHVHIKDFAPCRAGESAQKVSPQGKRYRGCEIGAGAAEVAECLERLKADGYKGWLSLEPIVKPALGAFISAARFVRGRWESRR